MRWDDACIQARKCRFALAVIEEPTKGREILPTMRANVTCQRKVRERWLDYDCQPKTLQCPLVREKRGVLEP